MSDSTTPQGHSSPPHESNRLPKTYTQTKSINKPNTTFRITKMKRLLKTKTNPFTTLDNKSKKRKIRNGFALDATIRKCRKQSNRRGKGSMKWRNQGTPTLIMPSSRKPDSKILAQSMKSSLKK